MLPQLATDNLSSSNEYKSVWVLKLLKLKANTYANRQMY